MISLPITEDLGQKYPIIQYTDDTDMIMPADIDQLMHLKDLLHTFSASTGHMSTITKLPWYQSTLTMPMP
jgi:hypothetical protein